MVSTRAHCINWGGYFPQCHFTWVHGETLKDRINFLSVKLLDHPIRSFVANGLRLPKNCVSGWGNVSLEVAYLPLDYWKQFRDRAGAAKRNILCNLCNILLPWSNSNHTPYFLRTISHFSPSNRSGEFHISISVLLNHLSEINIFVTKSNCYLLSSGQFVCRKLYGIKISMNSEFIESYICVLFC